MPAIPRRAAPARTLSRLPESARTLVALGLALALPLLHGSHAHALQLIEATDGVSVEAIVSSREPTRIRIDGAPITDVVGNIHTSRCEPAGPAPGQTSGSGPTTAMPLAAPIPGLAPTNPMGDVVIECQRDKGEIFVRPVGEGNRPVNLFVSSAQATYTLVLRRSDVPAETIVIRDRAAAKERHQRTASAPNAAAASHVRTLKAMLVAMAGEPPSDIRVDEVNRPVRLWAEADLLLTHQYEGRGLLGERYLLRNTSERPMTLAEPELDRESGDVAAIAIEQHNLRVGDSTAVYVIRRGGMR